MSATVFVVADPPLPGVPVRARVNYPDGTVGYAISAEDAILARIDSTILDVWHPPRTDYSPTRSREAQDLLDRLNARYRRLEMTE